MTEEIKKTLDILAEEIVPAEGCTEPIALAYAASLVTDTLDHKIPDSMTVFLSGNMIKNVKSVHIPNTDDKVGIEYAVAMGAILGDSSRKLMVISDVDRSRMPLVGKYVEENHIKVKLEKDCPKLYIRIEALAGFDSVTVEISDFHTNVSKLVKNGANLLSKTDAGLNRRCDLNEEHTDRSFLTTQKICDIADSIDLNLIEPLFSKVIRYNSAIADEGLTRTYGIAIGKTIYEGISEGAYGNDLKNNLAGYAAAGSDARMSGCPLPVMTTSGSGNQGMTCSLPIIKFCRMKGFDHERLIRSLFVSHMITIHIKEVIGRLSAYCGAMAASAGVAGALCYADRLSVKQVKMAVETTLATVSGIICDGAKSSCATKIATGVSMAVDAYHSARKNRGLLYGDGIVGADIESTIDNVGTLGSDGMSVTDDVILDIMMTE